MRESSKIMKTCLVIYFVFLAAFLCRVLFFTDFQGFRSIDKKAAERDYTDGWMLDSGEIINIDDFSAGHFGGSFCVSKVLPDTMPETDAIYFSTSNLRFKLYVSGELIYSYDTRENLTGYGDGVSYHMIGLGSKDEGKTVRIEAETVFANRHGGRFNEMQYGAEELYRYYVMERNMAGYWLSVLMIIFGVIVAVFYFGMSRRNKMMRPLWALGLCAVLFGLWSLSDTGVPQFVIGRTYATREIVYGILHFSGFPLIWFVSQVTKTKNRIYIYLSLLVSSVCFGGMLIARYGFDRDFHTMVGVIYFSYASQLILLILLLIDNEIYCHRKGISSGMRLFYIGAAVFIASSFIDMIRYIVIGQKGSLGHGSWFRFGLVMFFAFMAFQIFDWWASEKTSLERDRFINRLLQYVVDTDDPENRINKVLEYLCTELHADRAYIFEDMRDGTFDNTYEFCAPGVTPEIGNLKGLPYKGVVDAWYQEYEKGGHILIYDLEKYREVSENMYQVLKPQGIHTLVTGPLILDEKYIGFFGVDNPPVDAMEEISEIIRLLMYFLSEMVSQRDSHMRLVQYSYHDPLTGVGNRRALKEYEQEKLDTSRPYGFVMCDINGLKAVNDKDGHDAGDKMIRAVAACLTDVFGTENVYRMGGDEFSAYVHTDTEDEFEDKIADIRSRIRAIGVHAAIGYSFAKSGDPDFNARRIEADNRMYDEKREFYRDAHDRRNRRT